MRLLFATQLLFAYLILFSSTSCGQQTSCELKTNGSVLRYWLYDPRPSDKTNVADSTGEQKAFPLVLFLHGGGEGGGDVRLTIYPDAKHDSWTKTFENPKVYEWMLERRQVVDSRSSH